MRRVVITGLGVVSAIGTNTDEVVKSLRESYSGIVYMPEMEELGYKCCVYAPLPDFDSSFLPRKNKRHMSRTALLACVAAHQAVEDAGLKSNVLTDERTGVIIGTGAGGINEIQLAEDYWGTEETHTKIRAHGIARMMNSTASSNVAILFGCRGRTCSLSAACATGLYNIGHAFNLIRHGIQDVCLCGSAEDDTWRHVGLSADNSDGMPQDFNDRPTEACRPFDRDRQGLVGSAGAGVLTLESLVHAEQRNAEIYAEIIGFGEANDGDNMFIPTGDGLRLAVDQAMCMAGETGAVKIDYINPHGAGTRHGDPIEAQFIRETFREEPLVSSTKSISGHGQGATAAQEAVYTTLMLHHDFVTPTVNLNNIAADCQGINHVLEYQETELRTAMTFNSGLGGSNACLIMSKIPGGKSIS